MEAACKVTSNVLDEKQIERQNGLRKRFEKSPPQGPFTHFIYFSLVLGVLLIALTTSK
jgi:hypothetical protein